MNFHSVSPSHGLQFFTNCSSVGPFPGLQSFRHRLLQRGSPVGSQVLPENLLQRGLPMGSQPPLGIPLLRRGVLPGLQGDSLPHHGLPHGLQGNLCSSAWSIFSPPSALTWGSAGLFL